MSSIWSYSGWAQRAKIQVNLGLVESNGVLDFPMLVDGEDHLSGQAAFWDNVKADGADIRVAVGNDITQVQVPFEIEYIDTVAERLELYFKWSDMLDANPGAPDRFVYIYFDNAGASALPTTDPLGRDAVWSDYWMVYHMGSISTLVDSSGNLSDAPAVGTFTLIDGSNAGKAVQFNDTSGEQFAVSEAGMSSLIGTSYTILLERGTTGGEMDDLIVRTADGSTRIHLFSLQQSPQNNYHMNVRGPIGAELLVVGGMTYALPTVIQATLQASNFRTLRVNSGGRVFGTTLSSSGHPDPTEVGWTSLTGGSPHGGSIDEIRIRKTAVSGSWEDTEYHSLVLNDQFWTFIAIEGEAGTTPHSGSGSVQAEVATGSGLANAATPAGTASASGSTQAEVATGSGLASHHESTAADLFALGGSQAEVATGGGLGAVHVKPDELVTGSYWANLYWFPGYWWGLYWPGGEIGPWPATMGFCVQESETFQPGADRSKSFRPGAEVSDIC